jgi:hypothetical protein
MPTQLSHRGWLGRHGYGVLVRGLTGTSVEGTPDHMARIIMMAWVVSTLLL